MTTWLKGTTTWANLSADLTKLMAGEITDGQGNTCAVADRWVREVGGQDLLRSHASTDVALGDMSNRMGYFALFGAASLGSDDWHSARGAVARVSNVFTSAPGSATRWLVALACTTANSVAGNYSTATLRYMIYNADTGVSISTTSVSPNAGGVATIANGLQVTFSDPSGFLAANQDYWVRQFDTTYMGGIDWHGPMYPMKSGSVTYSVAPVGGTPVTDWDYVDYATAWDNLTMNSWTASDNIYVPRGGFGYGVGIKTNTGLTGNLYTYSYSAAQHKVRFVSQSGASNGQVSLEFYQDLGNDGGTYRRRMGYSRTWLRPFQTSGSVVAGAPVQYWMACGAASVAIVVNGDPLYSGKLSMNMLGMLTPYMPTYDKFPSFVGQTAKDYTADLLSASRPDVFQRYSLWDQKKRQDGSEGRDWQTKWSRCDFNLNSVTRAGSPSGTGSITYSNPGYDAYGEPTMGSSGGRWLFLYGNNGADATALYLNTLLPGVMNKPSPFDSKWWAMEIVAYDTPLHSGYQSNADSSRAIRGVLKDVLFTSSGGWASGDELLDTDTSKQYFLVQADYLGFYYRIRVAANDFRGGIAILESQ